MPTEPTNAQLEATEMTQQEKESINNQNVSDLAGGVEGKKQNIASELGSDVNRLEQYTEVITDIAKHVRKEKLLEKLSEDIAGVLVELDGQEAYEFTPLSQNDVSIYMDQTRRQKIKTVPDVLGSAKGDDNLLVIVPQEDALFQYSLPLSEFHKESTAIATKSREKKES